MNWTNIYFGIRVIFIIAVISLFVIYLIYVVSSTLIKDMYLKKKGFKYNKGLGMNVAVEFQPKYTKGEVSIRQKEVDRMSFMELRRRVKGGRV